MNNIKKLKVQNEALEVFFNSSHFGASKNKQGAFHWVTGLGKTYASILIIKKYLKENKKALIFVLVPSEAIKKQWEEYRKNFKVNFEIYSSFELLNKNSFLICDLLIVDELHLFYSLETIKLINGSLISFVDNLGLTGTYYDFTNREEQIKNIFPIIHEITEEEALKLNLINTFIEFNLPVKLTDEEQEKLKDYNKSLYDNIQKLPKDFFKFINNVYKGGEINGQYYEGKQHIYLYAASKNWKRNMNLLDPINAKIDSLWNPNKIYGYCRIVMEAIKKRKDLLYNAENKIIVITEIIKKLNLKTITFSKSIKFTELLTETLNTENIKSDYYHSNLKTIILFDDLKNKYIKKGKITQKKEILNNFKNNTIKVLNSVSALDTGFDMPDIELAITASGDSNFNTYTQRNGRAKRFLKSKKVIIVNLYVENSKEEQWLKKRQSKSTHEIYKVLNVEDISFNYVPKGININQI